MTRAKFYCQEKDVPNGRVMLFAVTSGSPENDQFFKLTPSGQLTLQTVNESAIAQFEVGKEYYVDISQA